MGHGDHIVLMVPVAQCSVCRLHRADQGVGPRAPFPGCLLARQGGISLIPYGPYPVLLAASLPNAIWSMTFLKLSARAAKAFNKAGSRRRGTRSESVSSDNRVLL
jgi:hypothetical protein